jgi:hypothetical protein
VQLNEHERRNVQIDTILKRAKSSNLQSYDGLLHWVSKTIEAEQKLATAMKQVVSTDYMQNKLKQEAERRQRDLDELNNKGS